jgi:DNA-binding transcriptional regulator PaaX
MKFNVARTTYGLGAKNGFLVQAWDLEDIRQPYRRIFESMLQKGHTVFIDDELVFLIRG